MRVLSWNVQGLGGPNFMRYRGRLRQELASCLVGGPLDVVMLQEHHLSESRIRRCGKLLRGHGETFWSAAFGPSGIQGGVCISVVEPWDKAVLDRGVIVPGRAQWIIMQRGSIRLGFLNVYAPNHASARAGFWSQIAEGIPCADAWCVGGDFNMLESPDDRRGGCGTTIHGAELAAWERLCLRLRVSDAWLHPGFVRERDSLLFSRSDSRIGGTNLSRLDRLYVSDALGEKGGTVGILAGTCLSDHAPILMQIHDSPSRTSTSLRIPEAVQVEEEMVDSVEAIWQDLCWETGQCALSLEEGLRQISELFHTEAKRRLAHAREEERRLHRGVASLQRQIEVHPDSEQVGEQLEQARRLLRAVEDRRFEFGFHRQASHWVQKGDRVTGDFFAMVGPRHARTGVQRFRREDGSLAVTPEEMRAHATEFYRDLLSQGPSSSSMEGNRQDVLRCIRRTVTDDMCGLLLAPFTEQELLVALRSLDKGSCPGVDGLAPAFFLRHWEVLAPGLCCAFQEVMRTGEIPTAFAEGLIFLIPKEGGNVEEIRQWRPITILNSTYKIFAKALSLRLQPMLDSLIHPTQTGFVKDRSILDNIFTFWEAVSLARLRGEELAILLLDFEKAYDRVDWAFLEAAMLRMGFPSVWIRGVSALYRTAHSQVLLAGDRGERFALSRSVRQGCPLAPTLFLFFAEAMTSFLGSQGIGLKGLRLPVREEELLDAEFADDTAVYLQGQDANLTRFQEALERFCDASGAKINWHKSCGFWVGSGEPPIWSPDALFRWVPAGTPVRYLGCQVGLDLTAEQQIAPLLLSIRKKLLFWSTAHLSLAGRVVVANQVLLATMWYITSCWVFASSCISQVQRLIRNFVWSGSDGSPARAKVAWSVITLPTALGGLGLVDPASQSRALLGKFIVRGMLPGGEPWKELLLTRLGACRPRAGGPWQDEIRWIFAEMRHTGFSRRMEDRFACSLLRTWELLRPALIQRAPTCPEEVLRQPLVWNPLVRTAREHMLGARQHVSWGALAAGPARSVGDWFEFRQLTEAQQGERLAGIRGATQMVTDIEEAIPEAWRQIEASGPVAWMGAFTRTGVLISVRGCTAELSLFFELGDRGRMLRVSMETELVASCVFQRVRVLGVLGRQWLVDPSPETVASGLIWRMWVWEAQPLARLQWDPGEWSWRDPYASILTPPIPFFQYSARLGRHILTSRQAAVPAAAEHWQRQGLSSAFLTAFWRRLWDCHQARRITIFQWLVAHRATAVGTWLSFGGRPPDCSGCGAVRETQRHCCWDCPLAQAFWRRILRLFSHRGTAMTFTWGTVAWGTLAGPAVRYETEGDSLALGFRQGHLFPTPVPGPPQASAAEERDLQWELISSLALWFVWRARCRRIFDGRAVPPAETVRDFWQELIHTLRGQLDGMQGDTEIRIQRRQAFLRLWRKGPFFSESQGSLHWHYRPPVWLFSPPPSVSG